LAADEGNNPKQKVDFLSGKASYTEVFPIYKSDEKYPEYLRLFPELSESVKFSIVELHPQTGRLEDILFNILLYQLIWNPLIFTEPINCEYI
jgi:hypothetical protein